MVQSTVTSSHNTAVLSHQHSHFYRAAAAVAADGTTPTHSEYNEGLELAVAPETPVIPHQLQPSKAVAEQQQQQQVSNNATTTTTTLSTKQTTIETETGSVIVTTTNSNSNHINNNNEDEAAAAAAAASSLAGPELPPIRCLITNRITLAERTLYNKNSNVLVINLRGLHIATVRDVNDMQEQLEDLVMNKIGTGGASGKKRVNVIINYDFVTIDESVINEYSDMCKHMVLTHYDHVSRYTTTPFLQMKKFVAELTKRNIKPSLFEGTSVGDYIFLRDLGEGTYGEVKLGCQRNTGHRVAVKIMSKADIQCMAIGDFVEREKRILRTVHHRNIANLVEILETPQREFIIVEYAKGGTLQQYIDKHRRMADESLAREIFRQMVDCVGYLHEEKHIVHRDLQLANMMLHYGDGDGDNSDVVPVLKIIDFGVSDFFVPGQKSHNLLCGNPQYCAPEMLQEKDYEGPEVDVWSLGVCLFYLVNGHLPFRYSSYALTGVYSTQEHEKVSSECKDLCRKILETDPQKRYTLNDIRQHPWMQQKRKL